MIRIFSFAFFLTLMTGCASTVSKHSCSGVSCGIAANGSYNSSGIVDYVWEEPMVDVVDVPPGLDPDGVYYRPAHKAVVEVRQGKWQHYDN